LIPIIQKNENLGVKRLQNFSSTYKHSGNCYLELISKLKKIIDDDSVNSNRTKLASKMLRYIEHKYWEVDIVKYHTLESILKMFDEPQKGGIKKRYMVFKKYGKRLVRQYKNGKEYCIINGKKIKI
jgi:adenylate kinase family enzyme